MNVDADDGVLTPAAAAAEMNVEDVSRHYCASLFDNVTCWPATEAGRLAVVPCPTHFRGLQLSGGLCASITLCYRIWLCLDLFPCYFVICKREREREREKRKRKKRKKEKAIKRKQ